MKKLFSILLMSVLLFSVSFAQGQKILIKSFQVENDHVIIDMNGLVEVQEWEEDFIRVTSSVELNNFDDRTLSRLIAVKRYVITTENIGNAIKIQMPNLANQVLIKGEMLKDVVKYNIFIPKGMSFEIVGGPATIFR